MAIGNPRFIDAFPSTTSICNHLISGFPLPHLMEGSGGYLLPRRHINRKATFALGETGLPWRGRNQPYWGSHVDDSRIDDVDIAP